MLNRQLSNFSNSQLMNSFLFTGLITQFTQGRSSDGCISLILYGGELEAARDLFEKTLNFSNEAERREVRVDKIIAAPVLESVLAETGPVPIDWDAIARETFEMLERPGEDPFAQGYWVDFNQWPAPDKLSASIEALQAELPEDIRSGLNWAPENQYYFLAAILSPPPVPRFDDVDEGVENDVGEEEEALESDSSANSQIPEKELAVVIRARNGVVAAWLLRNFARTTPLAANAIELSPMCEAVSVAEAKSRIEATPKERNPEQP